MIQTESSNPTNFNDITLLVGEESQKKITMLMSTCHGQSCCQEKNFSTENKGRRRKILAKQSVVV